MGAIRSDAVVVGAGIAGLAAALELRRAGLDTVVLERAGRAGGVMRSEQIRGYQVECGPNTVRIRAPMAAFLARHRLDPLLEPALPASRLRFLVQGGRLVPVPLGPLALARTPLLTGRGKLRLLAEPFVSGGDPTGETVAAFVRRRLGPEALERLVAPFLTGIYAGDETRLGAETVFPTLVEAERRSGSIVRGLLRGAFGRRGARGRKGTWSARPGLQALADASARQLGEGLRLHHTVDAIEAKDGRFRLHVRGEREAAELEAPVLILAVAAAEAAELLRPLDVEAGEALASIPYAPVVSVSLGVDPGRVREPIEGFGFLVPRDESRGGALLGCLYPSSLFRDRAPAGCAQLTTLLGGMRRPDILEQPDAELLARLHEELDRFLGLGQDPDVLAITRWRRAVAQPGPEHPRVLEHVRRRLAPFPGLFLAGSYLGGVAVGDAIESGVRAAAAAEQLPRAKR